MRENMTVRIAPAERARLEEVGRRVGMAPGVMLRAGGLRLAAELERPFRALDEEEKDPAKGKAAPGP